MCLHKGDSQSFSYLVEVKDSGRGVPSVIKRKLFEKPLILDGKEIEELKKELDNAPEGVDETITAFDLPPSEAPGLGCFNVKYDKVVKY